MQHATTERDAMENFLRDEEEASLFTTFIYSKIVVLQRKGAKT